MTITTEQLRVGLGLTRNEWLELQYAAIDREISTREFVQLIVRAAIRQSQSTRSTARKA